ncbi:EamA family transporter RarD [Sphingomonas sabuli]|uniref:EamA family transporter RarD n=1 Tax=Sphingomonas sabuli TaxID=2764186 RepID=A0A7G9L0P9_9SPHN|nr:EamA family transporter RarD [Sphingomonas sabuli]QNM82198.1 EamA family transporter RarD [Sphingomonas sabuli]
MNAPRTPSDQQRAALAGLWFGLGAYGLWGVLPIYFKALAAVGPVDIVAHRVAWSVPFLALLLLLFARTGEVRAVLRQRRTMVLLAASACLIAVNWLLYVYAVTTGHILAGSLGYYLNPLVNVVMGRFILKERLGWLQWAAVVVALAGISALAYQSLGQLWISLALAFSFATYGLLRKIASVEAVAGLAIETTLLLPLALLWLAWGVAAGGPAFGPTRTDTILLLLAGVATSVPLLLFTAAARRLRYSTLGMLQFIAPTLQFIIAVAFYGEAFTAAHAVAFGAIWIALILYVTALVRDHRSASAAPSD